MDRRHWQVAIVACMVLLLPGMVAISVSAQNPGFTAAVVVQATPTPVTTIVVNSTADYAADGKSKTCLNSTPCTLRRAINQAYSLGSAARPALIAFNIPPSDPNHVRGAGAQGYWKITLDGQPSLDELRELYGKTTVDGTTQPGGRVNGPTIIIDGAGNKNYGFIMRNGFNVVRGVAMQDFRTAHISIASDDNTVENCWFGLSDDGALLSSGDALTPEGGSGVALAGGVERNVVRRNVMAGFFGVAAAIRGDGNIFVGNLIGTRADGTVPLPVQFTQHPCLSGAWVGGSGITVEGDGNQIGGPGAADGNRFAGLFLDIFQASTQRPAMDVDGQRHTIQNNIIGLDIHDNIIGVCGRGLDLGGAPKTLLVSGNTLVQTAMSAVFLNGSLLNGNTLRSNIIGRAGDWPPAQGMNSFPEDAIAYGGTVPGVLRSFRPARVTRVAGLSVVGTAGSGSPCAGCVVELFLDDTDAITETLRSLAVVTADGGGNWTAHLETAIPIGHGVRTTSTVPDTFTIVGLATGTTSNLSPLQAVQQLRAYLPLIWRRH